MDTVRAIYPRRRNAMGQVSVPVVLVNGDDPTQELRFDALVDTGAVTSRRWGARCCST